MRTSILTLDKFIHKLLKGPEIFVPQDTHQSLCAEQEEHPQEAPYST